MSAIMHVETHTHAHMQRNARENTGIKTQAHTYTHTYTHTHTHKQAREKSVYYIASYSPWQEQEMEQHTAEPPPLRSALVHQDPQSHLPSLSLSLSLSQIGEAASRPQHPQQSQYGPSLMN